MVSFTLANTFLPAGVLSSPLLDQGPYLTHGWGEVVRLRHLYAARPGVHLLISSDGQIQGSADQTLYSKSRCCVAVGTDGDLVVMDIELQASWRSVRWILAVLSLEEQQPHVFSA